MKFLRKLAIGAVAVLIALAGGVVIILTLAGLGALIAIPISAGYFVVRLLTGL